MKRAVYSLATGPLRRSHNGFSIDFIRYLSIYRSFEFKAQLSTKQEKFKHVGDLYRYSKDICSNQSQRSMLINELSSLEYSKEHRSIMLWGLRRTNNYHVIVDIYDKIVGNSSVEMINTLVDMDSILLFAQALSKTGDFAKLIKLLDHLPASYSICAPNLFIQACCSQDKLKGAEDSMIIWLQDYLNNQDPANPVLAHIRSYLHCYDTDIKTLREPLPIPENKKPSATSAFIPPQEEGVSPSALFRTISSKCNIASELPDMETFHAITKLYGSRRAWVEISQLLLLLESMDLHGSSTPANILPKARGWYLSESLRNYLNYDYPNRKTMVNMYEHHIKALCESNLYDTASNVIADMNNLGYGFQPKLLLPLFNVFSKRQVHVADEFMDSFIAGFQDRIAQVIETAGKQLSHVPSNERYRILTAEDLEMDEHLDADTIAFLQNMSGIVAAVNQAICKKGKPEQAEEFMNQIALLQEKYEIITINRFAPQIIMAHIKAYSVKGNWKRAVEIYDSFEAARAEGKVTSPLSEFFYHHITKSMIEANDMVALVSFMERFLKPNPKPIDIVPKKVNRIQTPDTSYASGNSTRATTIKEQSTNSK